MENKQTAVEWLVEYLTLHRVDLKNEALNNVINIAKEMEKKQIIESYCKGCLDISKDENIFPRETSEKYYNETFKSE